MSMIVSICQHCDEQQFQKHYTIFSVVKLDLYIRALLQHHILALKKTTRTPHVHLIFYIVDTVNKYLFWVDKTEFIVHRMLYSGNENLRVAEAHSAISSLSLDQKVLYIPYISINA